LRHHTCLSERLIKHGLSVLIQHQLILWYTSDNNSTIYEANTASAYALVRSGKYIKIAEDQVGKFAGEIISTLLSLGHAQVGDLLEGFGVGHSKSTNGSLDTTDVSEMPLLNGWKHVAGTTDGHGVTFEMIQSTLSELLRAGLISEVHESHFRSDADNRLEAEKVVPPPEYYRAKSKRENEAQWETSIKKKLAEWKYGIQAEALETKDLKKSNGTKRGKKRSLENPEEPQSKKRLSSEVQDAIGAPGTAYQLKTNETGVLDVRGMGNLNGAPKVDLLQDTITLRINHDKFALISRNNHLIELADQSICTSTSKVYAEVLRSIQPGVLQCKDEAGIVEDDDMRSDLSSLPQVSTDELVYTLRDSAELGKALGKVDASRIDLTQNRHRKKRRKKEADSDDEVMADGDASSDESEDEEGVSNGNASNISSDSDEANGQAEYNPNSHPSTVPNNTLRETIRDHLLLLTHHPLEFLHHFPQTASHPERWTVNFPALTGNVIRHTLMQNITYRHGMLATRLVRILLEEGKVGEKELCTISLIKQQTLRSYLAALHQDGVAHLQEVPRDAARTVQRTIFLWFFDIERYKAKMLEDSYKAMARCVQRARVEGDKVKATVEKANRSDVVGKEEQYLTIQEREALEKWRAVEERIWGEVGRLDDLVAVIRDY